MEQTDLYVVTVLPMVKALENLSSILDKLSAHAGKKQLARHPRGFQEQNLLDDKLIFDQFPFRRQVQVACDNAAGGTARLAGVEVPSFPDDEKTAADLKTRIDKTISFMRGVKREQIAGHEGRRITLKYWPDKPMTAFGYATQYLIPNFYFHVATAYSILRKNGIDIGKDDYLGSLPFLS